MAVLKLTVTFRQNLLFEIQDEYVFINNQRALEFNNTILGRSLHKLFLGTTRNRKEKSFMVFSSRVITNIQPFKH